MGFREVFAASPFEPLRQHMDKVKETVDLVLPMFKRVEEGDFAGLEQITKRIFKLEHEADVIKNEIRQTIPQQFFLPVYRGDLLGYLKLQDDIADAVENLAVVLTIKKLTLPPPISEAMFTYVGKVLEVYQHVYDIARMLRELSATGLEGDMVGEVLEKVRQAERAEWEADKLQYQVARKLFALEDELKATDIFLWSRVSMTLGKLANYAEKTGDRVRRMLVH